MSALAAARSGRRFAAADFPRTNWEFTKWNKQDAVGFICCCALVGVVLLVFKGALVLGS